MCDEAKIHKDLKDIEVEESEWNREAWRSRAGMYRHNMESPREAAVVPATVVSKVRCVQDVSGGRVTRRGTSV